VAASREEDTDPLRDARAYNHSIYLMVSMPYALLTGLGLLFYRSVRAERQKPPSDPGAPDPFTAPASP
jgi:hypothetical protein